MANNGKKSRNTYRNMRGVNTICTEELVNEICQYLITGCYVETAAAMVSLRKQTLQTWLRRGRLELDRLAEAGPCGKMWAEEAPYVYCYARINEHLAKAEMSMVGKATLQQPLWVLARRWPEHWGGRTVEEDDPKTLLDIEMNTEVDNFDNASDTELIELLSDRVKSGRVEDADLGRAETSGQESGRE